MSEPVTGSVSDPEFRQRRARYAAKARTGDDYYICKLIESAPALTAEQAARLRALLPEPPAADDAALRPIPSAGDVAC